MCKEICWEEITKEIKDKNNIVLLGNGFSRSYDAEAFNQKEILKCMPSLEGKDEINDIEKLIEDTKKLVPADGNNTANLSFIHKWIEERLRLEFIKVLFEKMPLSIKCKENYDEKTLIPYRDFLSYFNQIFTLNYDPLIYWMTLRLKGNFPETLKKFINIKKELESTCKTDKKFATIEKKYQKSLGGICAQHKIGAFFFIAKDGEYEVKILKNGNLVKGKTLSKDEAEKLFKKDDVLEIIDQMTIESETNVLYRDEIEYIDKFALEKINSDVIECENSSANLKVLTNDGFLLIKESGVCEWSKENSNNQEVFYLHGAYHYFYKENKTIKITSKETDDFRLTMLKQIKDLLGENYLPITVLEDSSAAKENKIRQYDYLTHCFDVFKQHKGNLVSYGLSFQPSDAHIIQAIKENSGLEKIFIGYHTEEDKNAIKSAFAEMSNVLLYCTQDFFKNLENKNNKELVC